MLHHFARSIVHIALPGQFTYPFHYTPHPLCVMAAEEVQAYIAAQDDWQEELREGKMFGVLVVQTKEDEIGYLAAFPVIWPVEICIHSLFLLYMTCCSRMASLR